MKLFSKFVPLLIIAASTSMVRAQSGDPLDFSAKFVRNSAADVFIQWKSAPGYLDVLEQSNDSITWVQASLPFYGFGRDFCIAVPGARVTPGTSTCVILPLYTFSMTRYSTGTLMVRWIVTIPGFAPQAFRKYLYGDWVGLNYLGILTYIDEEAEEPYRVEVMQLGETLTSAPLPETPIEVGSPAEAYLNHLLDNYAGIAEANVAHPYCDPLEVPGGSITNRAMFRVHRFRLDSDNDGLSDYQELTLGFGDPLDADTDDDGTTDYDPYTLLDPMADTDGDGVRNGEDAVPYDTLLTWRRSPESRYVMLGLPEDSNHFTVKIDGWGVYLNNRGRIAFKKAYASGSMNSVMCTWAPGEAAVTENVIALPEDYAEVIGISDGDLNGAGAAVFYRKLYFEESEANEWAIRRFHRWTVDGTDAAMDPPFFAPAPADVRSDWMAWSADDVDAHPRVNGAGQVFTDLYKAFTGESSYGEWTMSSVSGLIGQGSGSGTGWTGWRDSQAWWGHDWDLPGFSIPDGPHTYFGGFVAASRGGKVFGLRTAFDPGPSPEQPDDTYTYTPYWGDIYSSDLIGLSSATALSLQAQNDWQAEAVTPLIGPAGAQFRAPYYPGNLSVTHNSFVFQTGVAGPWIQSPIRNWDGRPWVTPDLCTLDSSPFPNPFVINTRGEVLDGGSHAAIWRNGKLTSLASLIDGPSGLNADSINDRGMIAGRVADEPFLLLPVEVV